jgi:hypothetical protein
MRSDPGTPDLALSSISAQPNNTSVVDVGDSADLDGGDVLQLIASEVGWLVDEGMSPEAAFVRTWRDLEEDRKRAKLAESDRERVWTFIQQYYSPE